MKQTDLPLLLASDDFRPDDEKQPLDRLRMQKGVFLLEKKGPPLWRDVFDFVPYDWGPSSRSLSTTVTALVADGLLEKESLRRSRYHAYRTTRRGKEFTSETTERERLFVARVREFVTSRSFAQLLRDVYAEYPEYAKNSHFSG